VIVRAEIPWGLPAVRIKPEHLTQAVLNLVGNAAQATAERAHGDNGRGERADSSSRAEVEISARVAGHGGSVSLTVADNSGGMSPAVLARACEPFFTTRAARGGTGLGLAMVQRLVSDVGGCIRLRSSEGAGTSITVELPIAV
jgi:signal transduction histidine kinase